MAIEESKTVATLLGSQRDGNKKGGTYVFDDDKISIVFDTGLDVLTVTLKFAQGRETVLKTVSGGTPTIFRQGKWMEYIAHLLKDVKNNFSPIDDSSLFNS
jgi:hypothetical protein